jgi:hypothetical protein
MRKSLAHIALLVSLATLAACASTAVEFTGTEPKTPLCQVPSRTGNVLVLWGPQWRADQKDIPLREAAAEQGVKEYFAQSKCFPSAEIRRASVGTPLTAEQLKQLALGAERTAERVVVIAVRELGPIVKLLSSAALVEGGTEVVLHVSSYEVSESAGPKEIVVRWKNGGPGVIKGVATLPQDMRAALAAAFERSALQK